MCPCQRGSEVVNVTHDRINLYLTCFSDGFLCEASNIAVLRIVGDNPFGTNTQRGEV
ncbi:hypothetical protein H5A27_13480 [Pectobacterium brasiliense]|uniref:Uncharacterized protein n=1 Tax=Pectobacterium brasiliense TaxID=180957 RepID=A0ABS2X2P9_9GAMM|nr:MULTISPECIES: hypothetical protein [Pectobacterium]MBN3075591.1 hypothetical protein [Pectobacterium brasiliense]MBN3107029.1 hypothetical protein [Pectobacterium brasiliense]MBN3112506.1 hypothetical protein [Pectobacterium brasiliense]MBN3119613.1 hypothetical protein [Pectobacterium brasiliense]MBN3129432.1 hypothetical protein [Pectobacterium brasiliense]